MISLFTVVTSLLPLAYAAVIPRAAETDVNVLVTIADLSGTELKLSFKNNGTSAIRILTPGSAFYNGQAADGIQVYSTDGNGAQLPYGGMRSTPNIGGLDGYSLAPVGTGSDSEFFLNYDVAKMYNMSAGGGYRLHAQGALSFKYSNSTNSSFDGIIYYDSNNILATINGTTAGSTFNSAANPSTSANLDANRCQGLHGANNVDRSTALQNALQGCKSIALDAAAAVGNDADDRLALYFGNPSPEARQIMKARYTAIAAKCGAASASDTNTFLCDGADGSQHCPNFQLAYDYLSQKRMTLCPSFFDLPAAASSCGQLDQAGTLLYQFSQFPDVYAPGTNGMVYDYQSALALRPQYKMANGMNWAFYASGNKLRCDRPQHTAVFDILS